MREKEHEDYEAAKDEMDKAIAALESHFVPTGEPVMPVLLAMAGTRRFDSIAMFLEDGGVVVGCS